MPVACTLAAALGVIDNDIIGRIKYHWPVAYESIHVYLESAWYHPRFLDTP